MGEIVPVGSGSGVTDQRHGLADGGAGSDGGERRPRSSRRTPAGSVAPVDHVLATERLVLRPVTAPDHAALLALWTVPEVRRFLFDGAVLSSAEITGVIEDSERDFAAAALSR
jgi:RimJ/RimL family protein N-acetyltransferase